MIALDCETRLIGPEAISPEVMCVSLHNTTFSDVVSNGDPRITEVLADVLENEDVIIGHNIAFDLACIVGTWPSLTPLVVKALDEGRVADTILREKLINLATYGRIDQGPTGQNVSYALASLAHARVGLDLFGGKEGDDIWRLRYAELDGVPSALYPKAAWEYARLDAQATYEVWADQGWHPSFSCAPLHVKAAFCLQLMSARGLEVDPETKAQLEEHVNYELHPDRLPLLYENNILIPASGPKPYANGAKDHHLGCPRKKGCDCPVKMSAPTKERLNKKHGLIPLIEKVCKQNGFKVKLTDKGNVAADKDWIKEIAGFDDTLQQFAKRQDLIKLRTNFFPALEWPFGSGVTAKTVHPRYDVLKKTGRVSARGNSKKMKREPLYPATAIQQAGEVRAVYKPREGYVYSIVDYSGMELCSLAQVIYNLFGYSTHMDQINAGIDCHTFLGAVLAFDGDPEFKRRLGSFSDDLAVYEAFKASDPEWFKHWRTFAKPVGLGYPGGMGARTMVSVCAGYGYKIDLVHARYLKQIWLRVYPELSRYLRDWVPQQGNRYVSPLGMVRAGCSYTELANGNALQTPGAEGMKEAMWLVYKACLDPKDLMYGCYPVINMHDELVLEVPEDELMWARSQRQSELMVQGMQKVLPDVKITADPELKRRWDKKAPVLEPVRRAA